MVTFKPVGRMGNWLFECSCAYAYALKHNLPFSVPSVTNDPKWNPIYLPNLIHPDFKNQDDIIIQEKTYFKFDELPFEESWRGRQITLEGYFQNPKYFQQYRKELLELFNFTPTTNKGTVSIHQRRGDYLTLREKHPEVTVEWTEQQMDRFEGAKFIFFSDDIPWCRETFGHRADCEFSTGRSELEDLIEMSKCEHFINSASTFSWWGAWLSQNDHKKVVVPARWMTEAHSNQWTEEITPKEWLRL